MYRSPPWGNVSLSCHKRYRHRDILLGVVETLVKGGLEKVDGEGKRTGLSCVDVYADHEAGVGGESSASQKTQKGEHLV